MQLTIYGNCCGCGAWVIAELIACLSNGGGEITIVVGELIVFVVKIKHVHLVLILMVVIG